MAIGVDPNGQVQNLTTTKIGPHSTRGANHCQAAHGANAAPKVCIRGVLRGARGSRRVATHGARARDLRQIHRGLQCIPPAPKIETSEIGRGICKHKSIWFTTDEAEFRFWSLGSDATPNRTKISTQFN